MSNEYCSCKCSERAHNLHWYHGDKCRHKCSPYKKTQRKLNTIDADRVIDLIMDTLAEADGEYIAKVANDILSADVKYLEDSLFEIKWKV